MIKPILASKFSKNFVATTMFATAVLSAGSLSLVAQNSQVQSPQTELISNEAAKALQSRSVSLNSQEDFKHNKKLDKLYLKNCETDRTLKNKKESLDAIYNVYGTYGGVVELQRKIDNHFIEETINNYLEHLSFLSNDRKNATNTVSEFYEWTNDVFYTDLFSEELKMYEEQEFPTYEKVNEVLDNHLKNTKFFTAADFKIYQKGCDYFKSKQQESNSDEAKSDLLAYKTHLINALGFYNYLSKENKLPERHIFNYYFNDLFLNGEASIKP